MRKEPYAFFFVGTVNDFKPIICRGVIGIVLRLFSSRNWKYVCRHGWSGNGKCSARSKIAGSLSSLWRIFWLGGAEKRAPGNDFLQTPLEQGGALQLEQETLAFETPAVAHHRTGGTDHPVAGNDDRYGITSVGQADRTDRRGIADPPGELRVADRFAIGNVAERVPDAELKSRAVEVSDKAKVWRRPEKYFINCPRVSASSSSARGQRARSESGGG